MDSGSFNKNPAKTIKSGAIVSIFCKTLPEKSSSFEKISVGISKFLALSITLAFGLFVKTETTVAVFVLLKCFIMFSAFVPDPEAKITIYFIYKVISILQKKE